MAGQAIRRLAALVIIVAATACDNVEWGGAELSLQPPPPVEAPPEDTTLARSPDASPPPPLPEGPVLYMGTRNGGRVTLRPVAEVRGDTLRALPDESDTPGFLEHFRARRLGGGTEFVLFAGGSRVGTMIADTSAVADGSCRPHATVTGLAELLLDAADASRFLALPRDAAAAAGHTGYLSDRPVGDAAAVSINLASRVIMRESAYWPDDLGQARADLKSVPLPEADEPAVAATFLFRDRLAMEPSSSPQVAYSLFVLGYGSAEGHELVYDWYRRVEPDGKGAARYFEAADWDGDGASEILLEVVGESATWVAALDREGDRWRRVFEQTCTERVDAVAGD